jgi:hypothetical protein
LNFVEFPSSDGELIPFTIEYVAPPPAFAHPLQAFQPDIDSIFEKVVWARPALAIPHTMINNPSNFIPTSSS